jgi:hypothetical protein
MPFLTLAGYLRFGLSPVERLYARVGKVQLAIGAVLLGLVAVYNAFGMAALWLAVGLMYVIYLGLERRRGAAYFDPGGAFGNGRPALAPPGKQAPPPLAAPQIGRSRRPALPGPKK